MSKKEIVQIKWKKIFSPETLCQGKQKNIIYNNILQTKFNLWALFQNWKMLLKTKSCVTSKKNWNDFFRIILYVTERGSKKWNITR